jgi:hypothetical protein
MAVSANSDVKIIAKDRNVFSCDAAETEPHLRSFSIITAILPVRLPAGINTAVASTLRGFELGQTNKSY